MRIKSFYNKFFLLTVLLPLLFTSCLADYLNDLFDLHAPCYLRYETEYGEAPSSKEFLNSYTLTASDLPTLTADSSYITFEGWYTDSRYSKKASAGMTITEDTTLYAKWNNKHDQTFTITYVTEYGTTPYSVTVTWGETLGNYLPTLTAYNMNFEGWYLDSEYYKKAEYWMSVEKDLILYAKWTTIESAAYYYIYYYDDGGNVIHSILAIEGTYLDDTYFSTDIIPYPVQPGYDFNGWYTDPYNMINEAIYQFLYHDYHLYPSVTPRMDTPYTVEYYLMDTENNSYEFVKQDSYTLNKEGQTDSYISLYDLRDNPLDTMYQLMFSEDTNNIYGPNCGTINGDGSSVFRVYYYGQNIYPNQFEQMEAGLPNVNEAYNIHFKPDSVNTFSLENIKQIIEDSITNTGSPYYKRFDLGLGSTGLTEIPANIFEGKDYINRIYLPESCEKVGVGAFYGCYYLNYVTFPSSSDPNKKWYYMDDSSTEVEFDTTDYYSCAEFLKNNYYEIYLR